MRPLWKAPLFRTVVVGAIAVAVAVPAASASTQPALRPAGTVSPKPTGNWKPDGTVYAITVTAHRVFIGGDFTKVTNVKTGEVDTRIDLAAFSRSNGELVRSWHPSTDGIVRALVQSNGRLVAGGTFTHVNGSLHNRIAVLSPTSGAVFASFTGNVVDGVVRAIQPVGPRLYIGGTFHHVGAVRRRKLALISASSGAVYQTWDAPVVGGQVYAIALGVEKRAIIVGGSFTTLGGAPRSHLGSVWTTSSATTSWKPVAPAAKCYVLDVAVSGDLVFTGMAGSGGRVVAYGRLANPWRWYRGTNGDVQALSVLDGVLFLGGHFDRFQQTPRSQLASVIASTGTLRPFHPDVLRPVRPGVWAIDSKHDYIRVGGGFTGVGTTAHAHYTSFRYQP